MSTCTHCGAKRVFDPHASGPDENLYVCPKGCPPHHPRLHGEDFTCACCAERDTYKELLEADPQRLEREWAEVQQRRAEFAEDAALKVYEYLNMKNSPHTHNERRILGLVKPVYEAARERAR